MSKFFSSFVFVAGSLVPAAYASDSAEHATPHVLNWVSLLEQVFHGSAFAAFLQRSETAIFSALVTTLIAFFTFKIFRGLKLMPGRSQAVAELVVETFDNLVCSIMGPRGRVYTPFIGTLFIYILVTNLFGLVPLQNSSTGYLTTTAPLAISVFFYVQWVAITQNGPVGYIYHLAGSPKSLVEWLFVPLNLPLHILGEFIKPISLMFRLYGNIMAGHILVAVFLQLGIQALKPLHVPVGVPLHLPFLFLEIMVGAIQAFVFALLSTVYIAVMLPHDEEHAHAAPAHANH